MNIPKNLMYTSSHEWVRSTREGTVQIGLTDYAQQSLGDIVFVNLPAVGDQLLIGEAMGDVESVKAVSDIFSPVTGVVGGVNDELMDEPGLINADCYDAWLVEADEVSLPDELMTPEEYEAFVEAEG